MRRLMKLPVVTRAAACLARVDPLLKELAAARGEQPHRGADVRLPAPPRLGREIPDGAGQAYASFDAGPSAATASTPWARNSATRAAVSAGGQGAVTITFAKRLP